MELFLINLFGIIIGQINDNPHILEYSLTLQEDKLPFNHGKEVVVEPSRDTRTFGGAMLTAIANACAYSGCIYHMEVSGDGKPRVKVYRDRVEPIDKS